MSVKTKAAQTDANEDNVENLVDGKKVAPPVKRRNAQSLRGLRDELMPNYIKAADLAEAGEFTIIDARQRSGNFGEEAVFDIELADGTSKTLTLKESEVRLRLVKTVKKHGALGPLVLVSVSTEKGNDTWAFRDADEADAAPF